jgi:NACHT domain
MIDDIVTGVLVNVITATGARLGKAVLAISGRKVTDDLAIARWFDTYKITAEPPELRGLSAAMTDRLAVRLQSNEIQAVLHELLAARLTDAPETDVDRIRVLFDWTLSADEALTSVAADLFNYYDGQVADLTGRLEGSDPTLLRQIRDEALSARMIAILNAIERHTAALSSQPGRQSQADFLARYRRHVKEQHGRLEPPDFERRRRIPVGDLYVSPLIIQMTDAEPAKQSGEADPPKIDLLGLIDNIDRSVLLGDPGGGKTTAANVLMNHYASEAHKKTPFLVTLREFAATVPPERSVAGYIEHTLEVFYQCPAPPGLINLLLLTGGAVVIFDGLDELLDATHRTEITSIVERFATEYPLVPVLVTSRLVGYDQARLDDRQFSRYRLAGFTQEQAEEYVRKWFTLEDGVKSGEPIRWADSFINESSSVPDLRTNPLMLALMCILYRGERSLPRSRAEVYEQCASLLFRKWDARRRIHLELRAASHLEPALRHLAWWLFTRDQVQPAVTEHELVNETSAFLHGRGFESETDAHEAAAEFVEFCRGRLWVFSDTGTTAAGEALYSFTHRTFLEYFSAAHLAYRCDTPERLAFTLAPRISRQEWEVVGELAIQIKDRTSDQGADRIYSTLLRDRCHRSPRSRSGILQHLAKSLRSVDPSPGTVRQLTEAVLGHLFAGSANSSLRYSPLTWLIISSNNSCYDIISDELDKKITAMINSADPATQLGGLRLAVWLPYASWGNNAFEASKVQDSWNEWAKERAQIHSRAIIAAAESNMEMRQAALMQELISTERALEMPGGILPLVQVQSTRIFQIHWASHLVSAVVRLADGSSHESSAEREGELDQFASVGRFLIENPMLPWVPGPAQAWWAFHSWNEREEESPFFPLDPVAYLGAAAILLIASEESGTRSLPQGGPDRFGPLSEVSYYILRRWGQWNGKMPDLPFPEPFPDLILKWANNEIDFTRPARARR